MSHALIESPLGVLTAVVDHDALVGLYQDGQKHPPSGAALGPRDDDALPALRAQLDAYFRGAQVDFDLPLAPQGTEFQQQVWTALRAIPYGSTCSYAALAVAVGRPSAARAVGAANGRNPIGIVVPCHRVVGASGTLTGYAGGLENKRFLLDLEAGVGRL